MRAIGAKTLSRSCLLSMCQKCAPHLDRLQHRTLEHSICVAFEKNSLREQVTTIKMEEQNSLDSIVQTYASNRKYMIVEVAK